MKITKSSLLIFFLALVIIFVAGISITNAAANSSIVFPVKELGNCKTQAEWFQPGFSWNV